MSKYADKELLESILNSQYSLGEITPEILLNEFYDCYIYKYVTSYENYGSVSYSLTNKGFKEVDEFHKNDDSVNSANSWGGKKIKINELKTCKNEPDKRVLYEILQSIRSFSIYFQDCPKCNKNHFKETQYILPGKRGLRRKCENCGYEVYVSWLDLYNLLFSKDEKEDENI